MKFIHTGDIHLGAHPENKKEWATKRGDEIWESFERLIKKIKMQIPKQMTQTKMRKTARQVKVRLWQI